ncbi:MAG: hypothetical protein ACRCZI_00650, partial [Cetobacterium sp.]
MPRLDSFISQNQIQAPYRPVDPAVGNLNLGQDFNRLADAVLQVDKAVQVENFRQRQVQDEIAAKDLVLQTHRRVNDLQNGYRKALSEPGTDAEGRPTPVMNPHDALNEYQKSMLELATET